jgi:DNA-binding NtrC family response regulator
MATYAPSDAFPGGAAFEPDDTLDLRSRLLAYERHLITAALARTGGNQRRAARLLGILPTTLHEKRKRLGLRTAAPDAAPTDPREASA